MNLTAFSYLCELGLERADTKRKRQGERRWYQSGFIERTFDDWLDVTDTITVMFEAVIGTVFS